MNKKLAGSILLSIIWLGGPTCGSTTAEGSLSTSSSGGSRGSCPPGATADLNGVCLCDDTGLPPDPYDGCPPSGPGPSPAAVFYTNSAPCLRVSTQAITPSVLMDGLSFNKPTSTTATVTSGPTGVVNNGIITTAYPLPNGESIGLAHVTLPNGPIVLATGGTLQMTATSLGSSVGLVNSDFGIWAIENAPPVPGQIPSLIEVMTYATYAGGTLLTAGNMPTTGIKVYAGKMTGILEDEPNGGSDNVSGDVSFSVDFATGLITGSITNIATSLSTTTLPASPYPVYSGNTPFAAIILTSGFGGISGDGFQLDATTTTVPGSTIQTVLGKFYGSAGEEMTGTLTISLPSLYTPAPGRIFIGSFGAK